MANITKLAVFPATPEARKAVIVPEGFRLSILGFKTVKVEGKEVKRDSEAWIIPSLYAASATDKVEQFIADLIDGEQDELLRAYSVEGKIELAEAICNLEKLATVYFTDGRGNRTGIKQEVLIQWVNKEWKAYLDARIDRNMPTESKTKKDSFVASLIRQSCIAATRGNKEKEKSLPLETLEDLAKRLEVYTTDENVEHRLAVSDEMTAFKARIDSHIIAIKKAREEITVKMF